MSESSVIKVSAPGKVILHGEHAVVYGKCAVAASLSLRSYLELRLNNDGQVRIDLPAIDITRSWSVQQIVKTVKFPVAVGGDVGEMNDDALLRIKTLIDEAGSSKKELALTTFLYLYTAIYAGIGNHPAIDVKIHSDIPIGAGLGSSASLSVCLVTALLSHQNLITRPQEGPMGQIWLDKDLDLINEWAFQGEKIMHGRPSGIDNSVATFGGAIKFQEGKITKLETMPSLRILLINTCVPRSTKDLVAGVRNKYDKYPNIIGPVLESIEAVSERSQVIYTSLTSDDQAMTHYRSLEELIDFNQQLLQVLGVSHRSIDRICEVTSKFGVHSKLTGAGGGGCCFTLLTPDTPDMVTNGVKSELAQDGFECWETSIGGPGVQVNIHSSG